MSRRPDGSLTVIAPVGIDQAGLSILASRWVHAIEGPGRSIELLLARSRRHSDEGAAREIDDVAQAVGTWCERASASDRLLLTGLPAELDAAQATVAALAGAEGRATLVWERPHTPIVNLADQLAMDMPAGLRVVTLNPRFVPALRRQLRGVHVGSIPLVLPAAALECRERRPADPPYAIAVGRLTARKGARELCRRWVEDVGPRWRLRLLMMGSGYGSVDSQEQEVRELVAGSPWVTCDELGPIEARLDCMRAASCAVFAAVDDHLPQALIETMAVGTPVVATPIDAHLELVLDGETGFLLPHADCGDLSEQIGRVLTDLPEAAAVGARAAAEARRRFSPRAAAPGILAAISWTV